MEKKNYYRAVCDKSQMEKFIGDTCEGVNSAKSNSLKRYYVDQIQTLSKEFVEKLHSGDLIIPTSEAEPSLTVLAVSPLDGYLTLGYWMISDLHYYNYDFDGNNYILVGNIRKNLNLYLHNISFVESAEGKGAFLTHIQCISNSGNSLTFESITSDLHVINLTLSYYDESSEQIPAIDAKLLLGHAGLTKISNLIINNKHVIAISPEAKYTAPMIQVNPLSQELVYVDYSGLIGQIRIDPNYSILGFTDEVELINPTITEL